MSIHLITGGMFTGKTETLLKYLDKVLVNERVLLKYKEDRRYDDVYVVSHMGTRFPALNVAELKEFSKKDEFYDNLKLIAVDEGQFFPDLADHAHQWALHGKHVVIAAIQTDLFAEPLPSISRVIARADKVTYLSGICTQCNGIGTFSYRKTALPDGDTIQRYIGGVKDYTLLCRTCFQQVMHDAFTNRLGMFIKKEARDRFKESLKAFDITPIQKTRVAISESIKPPTNSMKNALDYLFARAAISRAPFQPHPSMINMEDCEFSRLQQEPSCSWFVGLIKKECRTYWTLTLNKLTQPAAEVCTASLWGGCPLCPRPLFKINDLTERDLSKSWTPDSICIYDIARDDFGCV